VKSKEPAFDPLSPGGRPLDSKPVERQKVAPLDNKAYEKTLNSPSSVDKSKFGLKTKPAPPDDGKRGVQVVVLNSGVADRAAASGKWDPHKHTIYVDLSSEVLDVIGLAKGYGEKPEGPNTRSSEFAKRVSEDADKCSDQPERNYAVGVEYDIDYDGTSVIKNKDGTIDTIKVDLHYTGKKTDTLKEHHK
jgi:hypothetical protein